MSEGRINRFYTKLYELKDWPDRDIIVALSNIAKEDITTAPSLAQLVVQRLLDPSTNSTYRRPLFYLIDSLMKSVGGPYASIFENHLMDVYTMTLKDIHNPEDIKKLDFLFKTWGERNFFSGNLLSKMRYQLSQPQVVIHTTVQPVPFIPQQPQVSGMIGNSFGGAASYSQFNQPSNLPYQQQQQQQQQSSFYQQPNQSMYNQSQQASTFNRQSGVDRNSVIFQDLVGNEMINLLNQLYSDLHVNERMSLEEIARENPALYNQIKQTAETNAEEILLKRARNPSSSSSFSSVSNISSASNVNHFVSRFQNTPGLPGPTNNGMMMTNDAQSRKRSLPDDFQAHNLLPTKQQATSSTQHRNSPSRSGRRGFFSENRNSSNASNIVSQSLDQLFVPGAANARGGSGGVREAPNLTIPSSKDALYSKPQLALPQGQFLNGYINETPVVVDIERVQILTNEITTSSIAPADILQMASKLANRLTRYLKDVKLPPPLPPILFGPLPVEPLYQTQKQPEKETSAAIAPVRKIPMPEFRISDLAKRPDAALKALYIDRPHQFHEDGLRFKTLSELRTHTDKSLSLKKISLKVKENNSKDGKRESREWYCALDNWVTDFDALNRKNSQLNNKENEVNQQSSSSSGTASSGGGGAGGKGSSGSSSTNTNDEFILPADENFTRCPISREVFATVWDDEEGEMMFRNAVKVLITEAADAVLYKLAKPIPPDSIENSRNINIDHYRYMIVHKLLVMDRWLAEGKAATVKEAIQRYESLGDKAQARIEAMKVAAGEDEEEFDDVFTVLEFSY